MGNEMDIVKRVIEVIVQNKCQESDHTPRVYSYNDENDFNALWKLLQLNDDDEKGVLLNENDIIIIIWKGNFPEHKISADLSQLLSPYHWVALLLIACEKKGQPICHSQVKVLNLSAIFNQQMDMTREMLNEFSCFSPLFQDVTPGHHREGGKEHCESFVEEICNPKDNRGSGTGNYSSAVAILKSICRAAVINQLDESNSKNLSHHDIANLIGPTILLATWEEDNYWVNTCLVKYLAISGVCPSPLSEHEKPTPILADATGFEKIDKLFEIFCLDNDEHGKVQFQLIDDHYRLGFDDVIKKTLWGGTVPNWAEFKAVSDPCAVIDQIVGDSAELLISIPDIDILFLDLRLWGSPEKFPGQLIEKAKCFVKNNEEYVPTEVLNLLKVSIVAAEEWVNNKNVNGSVTHLTLLPLLLSSVDPSLPIVVFSSTQQRKIAEVFKESPNILTGFSKPFPGNYSDTMNGDLLIKDLGEVTKKAISFFTPRLVWKSACEKWKNCDLGVFFWSESMGGRLSIALQGNDPPHVFLRRQWIPAMQRREYEIAMAMPWLYIAGILEPTRLALLRRPADQGSCSDVVGFLQCLEKIHTIAYHNTACKEEKKEMAGVAGLIFVNLISLWVE